MKRHTRREANKVTGHRQQVTAEQATVFTFEKASEAVQQYCRTLKAPQQEPVSISEALGRVLAEPVRADRDFPPFPRATRDGYAVRAANVQSVPVTLRFIGQIKAGTGSQATIKSGEAVEIMTGAAVPQGADAVVMVEYTERNGERVGILRTASVGENIVAQGSEARAGDELLALGKSLDFAAIAVAAAVGNTTLKVYRKPRVSILSTGDELVDLAAVPAPHQIRNSNSYSLAAQVMLAGGEAIQLPVAPDEKPALAALIQQGLSSDLLLLSGGVSMGQFDLVEQVLTDLGARFFFTGAEIQPGRPVVFGEVPCQKDKPAKPFFGLPGNPVSTMVTFDLFVRPVVQALAGTLPVRLLTAKARLAREIKTKTGLTRFLPATLRGDLYEPEVELVRWQGSGDIAAVARANCYLIIPPDRDRISTGEMISVLLRSGS